LNDLRVAYLHMQSEEKRRMRMESVKGILTLKGEVTFEGLYPVLLGQLTECYMRLTELLHKKTS
jgi:hypothetical protein